MSDPWKEQAGLSVYIVKPSDVGKGRLRGGPALEPLGIVQGRDVGKMCRKVGGVWQVENEGQFLARLAGRPAPELLPPMSARERFKAFQAGQISQLTSEDYRQLREEQRDEEPACPGCNGPGGQGPGGCCAECWKDDKKTKIQRSK